MILKPVKIIAPVKQGEIPDSKIGPNRSGNTIQLPTGSWSYAGGILTLNGKNITHLIEQPPPQAAAFWTSIAKDLDAFRKNFLKRRLRKKNLSADEEEEIGHLDALVEAYIAKVMRLLKRKYDETTDGLSYTLDEDGQLTLNGMNIHSFIRMSRLYPSNKAKIFLKGLKNRLFIILSNKSNNPNYDKIHEITLSLVEEIDAEILHAGQKHLQT